MSVEVGTVWDDADPREAGRTIEVMSINEDVAVVRLNTTARNVARKSIGRKTTVRLDRFGVYYTPSTVAPHRTGRHRETGELGYWPKDEILTER